MGCALLGSGGGGVITAALPLLVSTLRRTGPIQVVAASELATDARVACVGAVGSSTVMLEQLPAGATFVSAVRALERRTGMSLAAVQPLEIGGVNGLLAPVAAANLGLPLIDGDAMGRAYPRIDQNVLTGHVAATPLALASSSGDVLVLESPQDRSVEQLVRAVLPAMGAWAGVCIHPGTAGEYGRWSVQSSVRRALGLGAAARLGGAALLASPGVRQVFEGTVLEVIRRNASTEIGGVVSIRHAVDPARTLRLDFANEYAAAFDDGVPVAWAPDIICVLDSRTWSPVSVEEIFQQQRVRVLQIDAPPELGADDDREEALGLSGYGLAPVEPQGSGDAGNSPS